MSLVNGLILHTLEESKTVSQHSLLMKFYQIEKEIDEIYNQKMEALNKWCESPYSKKSKKGKIEYEAYQKFYKSFDLQLHFMNIEARTILYILGII